MKRADKLTAVYCRVACADDYALESQRDCLIRLAEEHGYENITVYADNGYSGVNFDRPALSRLETDIKAGKVLRVIVKDLSRITRDYPTADDWIDRLIASGVALVTADYTSPVKALLKRYAALY